MIESNITLEEIEQFTKMYSKVYTTLDALARQYFADNNIKVLPNDTINIEVYDLYFSLIDRCGDYVTNSGYHITDQELCCPAAAINRWRLERNNKWRPDSNE